MVELLNSPRVVESLERTLKAFHEAEEKNAGGPESISYRGQLGGYRAALTDIFGQSETSELLATVRNKTGLQFPHMGPVYDDGSIYNIDSEAGYGL